MKLPALGPKLLAISLLVVVAPLAAAALAYPLYSAHQANNEAINDAVTTLQKLNSSIAYTKEIVATEKPASREVLGINFLKGQEDSLIVAELQTRLRAIVVGNESELNSARSLPVKVIEEQTYVGLRIQIRGDMNRVHKVLHEIETGSPYLFSERVILRVEDRRGAVNDAGMSSIPLLYAELDVYGAKWVDAHPAPAGPKP